MKQPGKALRREVERRTGFTLTEIMVALALASFVTVGTLVAFSAANRGVRAGQWQTKFCNDARLAMQKMTRFVEDGKTVSVTTNYVDIVTVDLAIARIVFEDDDGDPDTVADNRLVYEPVAGGGADDQVLCERVRPIPGEAMFGIVLTSPTAVRFCFHVGDSTNPADTFYTGTGQGYQGVEVRFSATPRNLQRWYDS